MTNTPKTDAPETPSPTNRGVNSRSSSKILAFGLDWLSCTSTQETVIKGWEAWFDRVLAEQLASHGGAQKIRRIGYDGRVLHDNTFLGYRQSQGDALWISSGASAMRDWQMVAGPARRIPRVDIQVTCEFRRPRHLNVARDAFYNRDLSRLEHTYITSSGGSTCYVGSRSSDWFGRIYDKSAAYDKLPATVWRYEVCSKSKTINGQLVSQMQDAANECNLHEWVTSFVWYWFAQRSTAPAFAANSPITLVTETGANLTYPDRQLAWLRAGVAPVISRLVRDGFGDRAIEALGITRDQIPAWDEVAPTIGEKV